MTVTTKDRAARNFAAFVALVVTATTEFLLPDSILAISGWLTALIGGAAGLSAGYLTLAVIKTRRKRT